MCVCVCVCVRACVCMCGKIVRKEGNGQTQGRDQQTTVHKLFCRLSVLHCERVGECAYWKLHRHETTRSARSQQSLSSDFACTNLYENDDVYVYTIHT